MLYTSFTVNGKEYKCVMNMSAAIEAEKRLGDNPINVLIDMANNGKRMPSFKNMLIIIHASLQKFHHGISLEDAENILSDYIAEGHDISDLVQIMTDIFVNSGLLKINDEEVAEEVEGKNLKKRVKASK